MQNELVVNIDAAISSKIKKTDSKVAVEFTEKKVNSEEETLRKTKKAETDDSKKKEISTYENESEEMKSDEEIKETETTEVSDYKCLRKCTKSDRNSYFKIVFEVPLKYNILVLAEIEKQLETTCIRELPGIGKCHATENKGKVLITTEGVNFSEI